MKISINVDGKISERRYNKIKKYLSINCRGIGRITRYSMTENPVIYEGVVIEYDLDPMNNEKVRSSIKGLVDVIATLEQ